MGHTWRLGRIWGIELRIDHSWVIIAVLVGWSMLLRLRAVHPQSLFRYLVPTAVLCTVLFFGSVLFHEFTHALAAKAFGIPVKSITLFVFGGATHADVEARGAGPELVVSVLGPISSMALAVGFWLAFGVAGMLDLELLQTGFGFLAWINLVLAVFNLVPGFPLDGGRVLRATVWAVSGNLDMATRVAARVGEGIGYGLVALGAFVLFSGSLISGLWLAAIGWFLSSSARASDEERQVRKLLQGVTVDEVMERQVPVIPGEITIRQAVDTYLAHTSFEVYPVSVGGKLSGYLPLEAVRDTPVQFWDLQPVSEIMKPLDEQSIVPTYTSTQEVLKRIQLGDTGVVVVLDAAGNPAGVVTGQDIAKWIRRRSLLVR